MMSPKESHGRRPLGAQEIPWEGNPWEPKGSRGRGPKGAQEIAEGTLGSPGTTEAQFGGSWGLQEPFWRYSVMKRLFKKSRNHENQSFPVTVFDETRGNRCAIDARSCSNHRFINLSLCFHAQNTKTLCLADKDKLGNQERIWGNLKYRS